MKSVRILFFSDSHIGFDLPIQPRINRRRRGQDFLDNYQHILKEARRRKADLVIHGGDMFDRSKIPNVFADLALEPLFQLASEAVPVLVVPGNHERSVIPQHVFTAHPRLYVYNRAGTVMFLANGLRVAISAFPFVRKIKNRFQEVVSSLGKHNQTGQINLLCMHQAVEGATVGTNYTFRYGEDILPGAMIPKGYDVVLSGHIHRTQILRHDLNGRLMACPVVYSGSIERTSFAEKDEQKHFAVIDIEHHEYGNHVHTEFVPLPVRPMVSLDISVNNISLPSLKRYFENEIRALDPNSIVRLNPKGEVPGELREFFSVQNLREMVPASMNISLPGIFYRQSL